MPVVFLSSREVVSDSGRPTSPDPAPRTVSSQCRLSSGAKLDTSPAKIVSACVEKGLEMSDRKRGKEGEEEDEER